MGAARFSDISDFSDFSEISEMSEIRDPAPQKKKVRGGVKISEKSEKSEISDFSEMFTPPGLFFSGGRDLGFQTFRKFLKCLKSEIPPRKKNPGG